MAWKPLQIIPTPFYDNTDNTPLNGYWLIAFQAGTTTRINFAEDDAGTGQAAKVQINSQGFFVNSSSVVINPHVNEDAKLALVPTEAEADASDTSNSVWPLIDNVKPAGSNGLQYKETKADLKAVVNPTGVYFVYGNRSIGDGGHFTAYFVLGDTTTVSRKVFADDGNTGRFFVLPENGEYNALALDAYGDGSTDMTTIFNEINTDVAAEGLWLNIPKDSGRYTFASQFVFTCNIRGTGQIKTSTQISNGRPGVFEFGASDLKLEGLDFDCNSLSAAVSFGAGFNDCIIERIKSNNSYRTHITKLGSGAALTYRCKVYHCKLTNAGKVDTDFGDAMYFAGAHDFDIYYNYIDGYTRIGVTFEGDTSASFYSDSPKIHFNTILNGLNSTDTSVQCSGIWCENTNGSDSSHNTIKTVTNSARVWNSRGITRGGFRDGAPTVIKKHLVSDNTIDDVYMGLLNPGNGSNNKITNFKTGIYFSSGFTRGFFRKSTIKDTYFGYSTFDYSGANASSSKYPNCLVLINAGSNADITMDGMEIEAITKDAGETELADIFFDEDGALGTAIGPATTISFDATDNSINDTGAGLGSLDEGDMVIVSGSTSNNQRFIIKSQTSTSKVICVASTAVVTEAAGASITIQPYETLGSLTVKNVKYNEPDDEGLVIRVEDYHRCRKAHFINCPINFTLGSRPRFWDSLTFEDCTLYRNSPVDVTTRSDLVKFIRSKGTLGGRIHATETTGTVQLHVQYCDELTAGTMTAYNDMLAFIEGNTLDGWSSTEMLNTNTSYTVKAVCENNKLINNSGGLLVRSQDATDVLVFNDNIRDDATALYVDVSTAATITENDTTQI